MLIKVDKSSQEKRPWNLIFYENQKTKLLNVLNIQYIQVHEQKI